MISKSEFCKESAKMVKNVFANPTHCIYINDTIATLFEYMVYDFDGKLNGNFILYIRVQTIK